MAQFPAYAHVLNQECASLQGLEQIHFLDTAVEFTEGLVKSVLTSAAASGRLGGGV